MDAAVAFITNGEATKPAEPGERVLDDPAEHAKAAAVATAEDRNNAVKRSHSLAVHLCVLILAGPCWIKLWGRSGEGRLCEGCPAAGVREEGSGWAWRWLWSGVTWERWIKSDGAISLSSPRPLLPDFSKTWYGSQATTARESRAIRDVQAEPAVSRTPSSHSL